MNFLAHAYLSFNDPAILTGNMISDFVKGKRKFDYPVSVQKGITLHRAIDEFTDSHPTTQEAKVFFRKAYRLYAGAFVDVVYDHFLANDKLQFGTDKILYAFSEATYAQLDLNIENFPDQFAAMFPYMKQQNWLYHYRLKDGIEKSFGGLVRRAAYLSESAMAYKIFNENYQELEACYQVFFPQLKQFSYNTLIQLNDV